MKFKRFVCLLTLAFLSCNFFAQAEGGTAENQDGEAADTAATDDTIPLYAEPDFRHFANSLLTVTLSNLTLNFYNRVIDDSDYSKISPQTMWDNLKSPWVWDNDEFYINHLAHPYQGSLYFVAGRANGLNFWQSFVPNLFGVLTWEYLMETERQSLNDLVITPLSGAFWGEMFHRSYQFLEDICLPVAFVISPFDAVTRFVTGQRSPRVAGRPTGFSVRGGYSFILANQFRSSDPDYNITDYPSPTYQILNSAYHKSSNFYFGFDYVYGNKYGHTTKEPLDSFAFNFALLAHPGYFYCSVLSDSLIQSWALNTKSDTTIGITYIFDLIFSNDVNYNSNAIGATFAQKFVFDEARHTSLAWSSDIAFALTGASEYLDLHFASKRESADGLEQRLYDIGFGPNFRYDIRFEDPYIGAFYSRGFAAWFFTPEFTKPAEGSTGNNVVLMSEIGYEHRVWNNFSLGISEVLYYKRGNYRDADDVTHKMAHTNVYVKYKI